MDGKELEKRRGNDITYEVDLKMPMICEPVSVYKVDRVYTYEDYLNWPEDERIELIDGKIYYMSAPTKKHQQLLGRLHMCFGNYLHGKSCDVYFAPFDVRIDVDLGKDSVVQPDLVVICDDEKLDEKGLNGAPDLVIEILSKSTAGKDLVVKYNKYLTVGVREYWIVDQVKEKVMVNVLNERRYDATVYVKGDVIKPTVLKDLCIDVTDLFEGRKGREIIEVEYARQEEREKAEVDKLNIAKEMIQDQLPIEAIVRYTGLPIGKVRELM